MMHVLRRRRLMFAAFCLAWCGCGPGSPHTTLPAPPPTPLAGPADEPLQDEITNSIDMKLKLIKPGKFLMGSPNDEKERADAEGPQHSVEITRPFYIGTFPVTKGQFTAFVKDDGYQTEAEKAGDTRTWRNPYFPKKYDQTDDDPVVDVSWNDAGKFCEWLSKKEKKTYELPTEAEWEYACRAGATTAYSFGDDPKDLGDYAWYSDNSSKHTHPVGGKKPNAWGLYDMHGNVWQWCADWFDNYQDGRVLRGGSWDRGSRFCRSAYRYDLDPGNHSGHLGFRVVLRVPARTP